MRLWQEKFHLEITIHLYEFKSLLHCQRVRNTVRSEYGLGTERFLYTCGNVLIKSWPRTATEPLGFNPAISQYSQHSNSCVFVEPLHSIFNWSVLLQFEYIIFFV